MDLRERLAGHLYRSALSLQPVPIPVARLTHAAGVSWTVRDSVMRVMIGGEDDQLVPIAGSVSDLLGALLPLGITTTFVDPDLVLVPANALLPCSGSSASSATDALHLFTAPLWTMLDVYGSILSDTDADLVQALDQLFMDTADGELLDVWAEYFRLPRRAGETDEDFYPRIVRETLRPRNNRFAIEAAIRDETGLLVSLREPHQEIFRLSISGLSGGHHLQDGKFYTWNVFQPVYHSGMSLEQRQRVLEIIERNRPAGCLVVGAEAQPPIGYAEANLAWGISSTIILTNDMGLLAYGPGLLSASLFLSDTRELVNSSFVWTQSGEIARLFSSDTVLGIPGAPASWTGGWSSSPWMQSSVSAVVTQQPA